jgi:LPXTG-motif cell wall-anchored protein
MGKWLGVVAVAAVVALGGPVADPAAADDMNMNSGATCSPAGTSLALTAQDHGFDKNCLAVPAGEPFTIRFDNKDTDRHNVAILPSHMSTEAFFRGDIVLGPKTVTYSVPALKPGTWHFHCEIHPNLMNGTFIAAAAPAAPAPAPVPAPTPAPKAPPAPPPATSMGGGMPVLTPTPSTAAAPNPPAAEPAAPAPAPKAAAAATPPSSRAAAGAAAPPAGTASTTPLPRTGAASNRLLLLLAGGALLLGGLSVLTAARRRPAADRILR